MSHRILLRDHERSRWLEFVEPLAVLQTSASDEVLPLLRSIEQRVRDDGLYAAGYVSYEAAAGFDAALETHRQTGWPLLSFGLFAAPVVHDSVQAPATPGPPAETWRIGTERDVYARNIRRIREQIALGNTYQTNYTIRAHAARVGDPWELFLRIAADAPYAAYLEAENYAIVSASPELFFRLDGDSLLGTPMKGTAKRGMTLDEDRRLRARLQASPKERAENVMIADMIRNDMGRIAEPGSVVARDLYRIEKYPTVWQMTSTVAATSGAAVAEIFSALFPCASVTGAPKVSSMKLIAELEESARHIYTGAIGYIAPRRQAQFSVAIRTAFVDRKRGSADYGIGGGIVWHSDADDEYEECMAKAAVLFRRPSPRRFELLETLRWTKNDGFFLLQRHLDRLRSSAEYFDYRFDAARAMRALQRQVTKLGEGRHRLRLLLARDGRFRVSATPVAADVGTVPVSVRLAAHPVDANDPFLYHKTSWRDCYERAVRETPACDDVLLWNGDGYITESTVANVLIRIDGRLCTPPVDCGLLAGTYRRQLLEENAIEERRIHVSELRHGDEIVLINSVRGDYPAILIGDTVTANRDLPVTDRR